MTIEDLKTRRVLLEVAIFELVDSFEKETSVTASAIKLNRVDVSTFQKDEIVLDSVSVEITI